MPGGSEAGFDHDRELRIAKLDLFAKRTRFNAIATVLNALLLSTLLHDTAPSPWLAVWAGAQLAGATLLLARSLRKRRPPRGSARGPRRAALFSTIAGLFVGSSVFLLDGASDLEGAIVFITIGSMASAASTALASIPGAARGYIAGALLLPAAFWFASGSLEYAVLAGLSLSMTFFLVRNARITHDAFLDGFERERRIAELHSSFQAELSEWLDLSQATEAFALLDAEGFVLLYNAAFERLAEPFRLQRGVSYRALIERTAARPARVDGHEIGPEGWVERRLKLVAEPGELVEEYPSGEVYRVSSRRLPSGRLAVLALNVTALTLAERSLREREITLAHSQRLESVGTIAGGVAHDFNNLLTAISGATSLLDDEVKSPEGRECLDGIQTSVRRGAELTRQLLAYGRRQSLRPRPLSLNDLIEANRRLIQGLVPATVELKLSPAPGLAAVMADPERLTQVLVNLVLNARDAMPKGGRLEIATRNRERAEVELAVSDSGVGMSPETQERIFEPFFSLKDHEHGSGLGLSAVQGIVRQSEGRILVESALGQGTHMRILLPRCDETPEAIDDRSTAAIASPQRAGTVLLVDDDDAVRNVTARLLSGLGYSVVKARSGREALELLTNRAVEPSILITDVVMPDMNGPELAAHVQAERPGLPILFVSGYDAGVLHQLEAHSALRKPFTIAELSRAIARALSGSSPTASSAPPSR